MGCVYNAPEDVNTSENISANSKVADDNQVVYNSEEDTTTYVCYEDKVKNAFTGLMRMTEEHYNPYTLPADYIVFEDKLYIGNSEKCSSQEPVYERYSGIDNLENILEELNITVKTFEAAYTEDFLPTENGKCSMKGVIRAYIYQKKGTDKLVLEYVDENNDTMRYVGVASAGNTEDIKTIIGFRRGQIEYTGSGIENSGIDFYRDKTAQDAYDFLILRSDIIRLDEKPACYDVFMTACLNETSYAEISQPMDAGYEDIIKAIMTVYNDEDTKYYMFIGRMQ